jgi:hypothetical protein
MPLPLLMPIISSAIGAIGAGGAGAGAATAGAAGLGKMLSNGSGALFELISGGAQAMKANKASSQADRLQPPLYDPQQLALLDEINHRRRSLQTGSAYAGQMAAIDSTTAGVNQAITELAGGNTSSAIQGLLASQSNAARAKNQVLGQEGEETQFYSQLGVNMQGMVSQRALELQLAQQSQKRAEWAQGMQDSYGNIGNAAARFNGGQLLDILKKSMAGKNRRVMGMPETTLGPDGVEVPYNPVDTAPVGVVPGEIPQVGGDFGLQSILSA